MDWGSTLIGMGGLVLAGFTNYMALKSTSSLQDALHTRQIDICLGIIAKLTSFHDELVIMCEEVIPAEDEGLIQENHRKFYRQMRLLMNESLQWYAIAPADVLTSVCKYFALIDELNDPNPIEFKRRLANLDSKMVTDIFFGLMTTVRKSLGIELLTAKTCILLDLGVKPLE